MDSKRSSLDGRKTLWKKKHVDDLDKGREI
jgi:hypothetical protein